MIQRLIISAPFGNYLSFPYTTPTYGTFTPERRGGAMYRAWRVLRTLRPVPFVGGAWRNRLGLPNPGIDALDQQTRSPVDKGHHDRLKDVIISVTAFDCDGWRKVLTTAVDLAPLAVEMNVSCVNVAGSDIYTTVNAFRIASVLGADRSVKVIVKLPPIGSRKLFDLAVLEGIGGFHCLNTLPVPSGGLSGKPLKPISLEAVRWIGGQGYPLHTLIGGGGITTHDDVRDYLAAGATHVAVGSAWLNPLRWPGLRRLAKRLAAEGTTKGASP